MAGPSAAELAFAEAVLIEGRANGPRVAIALKARAATGKPLPAVLSEMGALAPDVAKKLWANADAAARKAAKTGFSFSPGAFVGPYELTEPRGAGLFGEHWKAVREGQPAFLRLLPTGHPS